MIYLISQTPDTNGVFDTPAETDRMVYCTLRSVSMSEFYRAREYDLAPELVFVLTDFADYDGEKVLRYGDKRYDVIRTYINGQSIEITAERSKHGAGVAPQTEGVNANG